jgi:hypothetical protein
MYSTCAQIYDTDYTDLYGLYGIYTNIRISEKKIYGSAQTYP